MSQIDYSAILKTGAYYNGVWHTTAKTYPIINPANGQTVAEVAYCGAAEAKSAVDSAENALSSWQAMTAKMRSNLLKKWFDLIIKNQSALAALLVTEQGKPLSEGMGEVLYAASFVEWFAEEAKRIYGDVIPSHKGDARIMVLKQPVGVIAAITPWNFPLAMLTRKIAPALAAGCTAVIKPSEETPLSAHALVHLAQEAGIPEGVLNVVSGNAPEIGQVFTSDKRVRKISFTGSTKTGKYLYSQCAETMKKMSLELGGNAAFIVFDDADIDAAIAGAMASKFRNTGQTCVCVNRFFIHDSVYEKFVTGLATEVNKLIVGDAFTPNVTQGPLINEMALAKVKRHVEDALNKGARALTGAKQPNLGGTYFEPTVLADAHIDMEMSQEETFGPIAACYRFTDEDDVIKQANATDFGLSSYFYTRDVGRAWRVAEALECGMIAVNEGMLSTEIAPFGGIKDSGLGREGSKYGIEEYLNIKYVLMGGI
ncbi:NAD-dependent succinate-semialdehyde dehydrogenase [Thorsellia anophelis]|uniref:Succinate-semialdehyde dehydrogenase / glutarate-semialdehyde dehydrogenase n=1 Tax=Thorsellia anophelis DSM 18579 TaxID=1123402 RepID=A0A1I0CUC4_9GAMM|nr:NAD-dependent succinate-semialdehyde dehydrogenase [Thorsellia anophelis]SET23206.1 succinate-semialdehyde dehydrogenase / glutarate-semialdehyde dehydrogenase [Thorsellia anophelis DSM 18579]